MSVRLVIPIVTLSAFWLMLGIAAAFEQHGFHSGMTLAEATASTQESLVPMPGSSGNYTVGEGASTKATIGFCKGRLFAVNENIAGEVDAFAGRTAKNNAQFGLPIVAAVSDYTNNGLISYVRLTWQTAPGEDHTISISRYQGTTWASVGSSAFMALCK